MTIDESLFNRVAFAGITKLTVLTWYALPDAVRSRPVRAVIKTGLLGVTAAGALLIPTVYPAKGTPPDPAVDLPAPAVAALGVGATVAGLAATVWFEKAIFAAGEARRARGVRCAHTPAALALAAVSGAAAMVDWGAIASRMAKG